MQRTGGVGRGQQMCLSLLIPVGLALTASGCASMSGAQHPNRFALTQTECNQTDTTVSCCLKNHPGEYERCAATTPRAPPSQPHYLPPGRPESEASPIPELPTQEERDRWDKEICRPYYAKCIRAGGDSIEGRKWNETQCQACYDACRRHGYWPWQANDKPCPGA